MKRIYHYVLYYYLLISMNTFAEKFCPLTMSPHFSEIPLLHTRGTLKLNFVTILAASLFLVHILWLLCPPPPKPLCYKRISTFYHPNGQFLTHDHSNKNKVKIWPTSRRARASVGFLFSLTKLGLGLHEKYINKYHQIKLLLPLGSNPRRHHNSFYTEA